ncbi:MAG: hypothetical protein OXF30_02425 [Candidatus Saccharibacteria bacterium]|nr:hypothetical protein [Candidatus Saccharibacteria bacterium]
MPSVNANSIVPQIIGPELYPEFTKWSKFESPSTLTVGTALDSVDYPVNSLGDIKNAFKNAQDPLSDIPFYILGGGLNPAYDQPSNEFYLFVKTGEQPEIIYDNLCLDDPANNFRTGGYLQNATTNPAKRTRDNFSWGLNGDPPGSFDYKDAHTLVKIDIFVTKEDGTNEQTVAANIPSAALCDSSNRQIRKSIPTISDSESEKCHGYDVYTLKFQLKDDNKAREHYQAYHVQGGNENTWIYPKEIGLTNWLTGYQWKHLTGGYYDDFNDDGNDSEFPISEAKRNRFNTSQGHTREQYWQVAYKLSVNEQTKITDNFPLFDHDVISSTELIRDSWYPSNYAVGSFIPRLEIWEINEAGRAIFKFRGNYAPTSRSNAQNGWTNPNKVLGSIDQLEKNKSYIVVYKNILARNYVAIKFPEVTCPLSNSIGAINMTLGPESDGAYKCLVYFTHLKFVDTNLTPPNPELRLTIKKWGNNNGVLLQSVANPLPATGDPLTNASPSQLLNPPPPAVNTASHKDHFIVDITNSPKHLRALRDKLKAYEFEIRHVDTENNINKVIAETLPWHSDNGNINKIKNQIDKCLEKYRKLTVSITADCVIYVSELMWTSSDPNNKHPRLTIKGKNTSEPYKFPVGGTNKKVFYQRLEDGGQSVQYWYSNPLPKALSLTSADLEKPEHDGRLIIDLKKAPSILRGIQNNTYTLPDFVFWVRGYERTPNSDRTIWFTSTSENYSHSKKDIFESTWELPPGQTLKDVALRCASAVDVTGEIRMTNNCYLYMHSLKWEAQPNAKLQVVFTYNESQAKQIQDQAKINNHIKTYSIQKLRPSTTGIIESSANLLNNGLHKQVDAPVQGFNVDDITFTNPVDRFMIDLYEVTSIKDSSGSLISQPGHSSQNIYQKLKQLKAFVIGHKDGSDNFHFWDGDTNTPTISEIPIQQVPDQYCGLRAEVYADDLCHIYINILNLPSNQTSDSVEINPFVKDSPNTRYTNPKIEQVDSTFDLGSGMILNAVGAPLTDALTLRDVDYRTLVTINSSTGNITTPMTIDYKNGYATYRQRIDAWPINTNKPDQPVCDKEPGECSPSAGETFKFKLEPGSSNTVSSASEAYNHSYNIQGASRNVFVAAGHDDCFAGTYPCGTEENPRTCTRWRPCGPSHSFSYLTATPGSPGHAQILWSQMRALTQADIDNMMEAINLNNHDVDTYTVLTQDNVGSSTTNQVPVGINIRFTAPDQIISSPGNQPDVTLSGFQSSSRVNFERTIYDLKIYFSLYELKEPITSSRRIKSNESQRFRIVNGGSESQIWSFDNDGENASGDEIRLYGWGALEGLAASGGTWDLTISQRISYSWETWAPNPGHDRDFSRWRTRTVPKSHPNGTLQARGTWGACTRTLIVQVPDCNTWDMRDPPVTSRHFSANTENSASGRRSHEVFDVGEQEPRSKLEYINRNRHFHILGLPKYSVIRDDPYKNIGGNSTGAARQIPTGQIDATQKQIQKSDRDFIKEKPTTINYPGSYQVTWIPTWRSDARRSPWTADNLGPWKGKEIEQTSCFNNNPTLTSPKLEKPTYVWADPPNCEVTLWKIYELGAGGGNTLEVTLKNPNKAPMRIDKVELLVTPKVGASRFTSNNSEEVIGSNQAEGQIIPANSSVNIEFTSAGQARLGRHFAHPSQLGQHYYEWKVQTSMGVETWSTKYQDVAGNNNGLNHRSWFEKTGQAPGTATSNTERIITEESNDTPPIEPAFSNHCVGIYRPVIRPYVKVFYSSLIIGGRFNPSEGRNCPNLDFSQVKGYILGHTNPNPIEDIDGDGNTHGDITGSSTEYSLQVTNQIDGFYSASQRQSKFDPSPKAPSGLTLGNTNPTLKYGGHYGKQETCIANYWRKVDKVPSLRSNWLLDDTLYLSDQRSRLHTYDVGGGKYKYNGDLIIRNNSASSLNLKTTLYVNGDVRIKDNIYNNNDNLPWTHPVQIGYIFIIAKGNIYIDPSVTNIDAILVAYPESHNDDDTGRIWTCDPEGLGRDNHYYACNKKLIVNGALIAQNLHLGRFAGVTGNDVGTTQAVDCLEVSSHFRLPTGDSTKYCGFGSEGDTPNNMAGEEINLLPEYYIGLPSLPPWDEWMYERDSFAIKALNW